MFDAKPKVRDAAGDVPTNYQPDLLDPLGRTVSISLPQAVPAAAELLPRRDSARPQPARTLSADSAFRGNVL